MKKKKEEKRVFRTIKEFEKTFLPKSFEKKKIEKPEDAKALGIILAKESLEKIRRQLENKNS